MYTANYHQDSFTTRTSVFASEAHAHLNKMIAEAAIETDAQEIIVTPVTLVVLQSGNCASELACQLDTNGADPETRLIGFLDGVPVRIDPNWTPADDVEGLATLTAHDKIVGQISIRGIHFV